MAGVATGEGEMTGHVADVHVVALIEGHRRRLGQGCRREAVREVAGDEGGAGGEQIAHLAEFVDAAAASGWGCRLTAPNACPSRTRSRVRLSSSTSRFSSMGYCSSSGARAGRNQVARLSALTAMLTRMGPWARRGELAGRAPAPAGAPGDSGPAASGRAPQRLAADDERLRNCSSCLMRWEMADWVMCSAGRPARSSALP